MQVPVNINEGITDEEAEKVVKGLALKKADLQQGIDQIKKFYKLFSETDCTQIEVISLPWSENRCLYMLQYFLYYF